YEDLWIHIVAALSVNIGGIGNAILYVIYENCNTNSLIQT
ncbi:27583_t:CDS:1, partial [Gigaspora margarita]